MRKGLPAGECFVNLSPHGLSITYTSDAESEHLDAKRRDAYRWMQNSRRALSNRGELIVSVYGRWREKLATHPLSGTVEWLPKLEIAPGRRGELGELNLVYEKQ